ncbi:NADPH-dependent FMN reductase [Candidatus Magnetoovum chiemensis]|nr:NADPH-dependent FMN reductase [Candidatus Magnetoovum chiemensis]
MAKTIKIICGSPRKNGNTNTVVKWFVEGLNETDSVVELIDAARLKSKVNGCISCKGCQRSELYECVIDDELQPILASLPSADVLVFATPVFFFSPTAQIKAFIDRMYSLFKINTQSGEIRHNLHNKTLAAIITAGGGIEDSLNIVNNMFQINAKFANMNFQSLLIPFCPDDPKEMQNDEHSKQKAFEFAKKISNL